MKGLIIPLDNYMINRVYSSFNYSDYLTLYNDDIDLTNKILNKAFEIIKKCSDINQSTLWGQHSKSLLVSAVYLSQLILLRDKEISEDSLVAQWHLHLGLGVSIPTIWKHYRLFDYILKIGIVKEIDELSFSGWLSKLRCEK